MKYLTATILGPSAFCEIVSDAIDRTSGVEGRRNAEISPTLDSIGGQSISAALIISIRRTATKFPWQWALPSISRARHILLGR